MNIVEAEAHRVVSFGNRGKGNCFNIFNAVDVWYKHYGEFWSPLSTLHGHSSHPTAEILG